MMIYPPIAELVEKTGSRYILVIEAAKRARQLSQGAEPLTKCDSNKEVSIATNEIYEGKLEFSKVPIDNETESCACPTDTGNEADPVGESPASDDNNSEIQ